MNLINVKRTPILIALLLMAIFLTVGKRSASAASPKSIEYYYGILGLTPQSTKGEVKKAYRRLAMKYHPDRVSVSDTTSELKFKEISEAYEILKNVEPIQEEEEQRQDPIPAELVNVKTPLDLAVWLLLQPPGVHDIVMALRIKDRLHIYVADKVFLRLLRDTFNFDETFPNKPLARAAETYYQILCKQDMAAFEHANKGAN
jgi:curved DNA-binding protein CbpA